MTATMTEKPYGRSEARSAAVVVRMSPAEREALNAAAEAMGITVTELMRAYAARVSQGAK